MKKALLVAFSLLSVLSFAQSTNQYQYVFVPAKFDFQESENEYRLNTLLKFRLIEYGFDALFTSDEFNSYYAERCRYLNADVVDDSGLLNTKLYIVLKDCNNKIVFRSDSGSSKIKDRQKGYTAALEEALKSVKALNYKYQGDISENQKLNNIIKTEIVNSSVLLAQPTANGFQLLDQSQKVIVKMFKTAQTDYFSATSDTKNGVVFKKDSEWFFEYYVEGKLISEKLNIKF
jgi:hypothetical protein